jgi:sialic acid synthase SpsE
MKIAEIGWNFMGDMQLAEQMVDAAANSGATHVKFQYWNESNLKPGKWDEDGRREIYKSAQLNEQRIKSLKEFAKKNNLTPFFSVFSISSMDKLKKLGDEIIKVPSHEIYNLDLIKNCFDQFNCVILSTGACKEEELIQVANLSNKFQGKLIVMHCVSSYPCTSDLINLPRLDVLAKLFPNAILGLSDHTPSTIVPAISVAFNVRVIEKHFTTDQNLPGRDNKFALLPNQFKQMVLNFDEALSACQFQGVGAQDSEADIIKNYRGRWGS